LSVPLSISIDILVGEGEGAVADCLFGGGGGSATERCARAGKPEPIKNAVARATEVRTYAVRSCTDI
jgi:hypothetical protein